MSRPDTSNGLTFTAGLKRVALVVGAAAVALSTLVAPAQAAPVGEGVGPTVQLAVAGDSQVLVQWDSPQTTFVAANGAYIGPTGFDVKVSNPGSETALFVSSNCTSLTAEDFDCAFLMPLGKTAFDVRVRAKFLVDGVTHYSNWGLASINSTLMTHVENLLVQPSGANEFAATWTNASAAAQAAVSAVIFVDDVERLTVPQADGAAPDYAVVGSVAAGAHTVKVSLRNAAGAEIGSYTTAYTQPEVPAAPALSVTLTPGMAGTETAKLSWLPPVSATTVTAWDVLVFTDAETMPAGCEGVAGSARNCTLTGLDPTAGYEFAVRAVYGVGELGDAGYARVRVTPVRDLTVEPTSDSAATVYWGIDPVLEPQLSDIEVWLDGELVSCPDALLMGECELAGLAVGGSHEISIRLFDETGGELGRGTASFTFAGIPSAPQVQISAPNAQGVSTVTWGYAGALPAGVNGWDVVVYNYDGVPVGTCADGDFALTQTSCTLGNMGPTNGVLVEVRAKYGRNLLGTPGRAYLNITPVANLLALTGNRGEVSLSWELDLLVDLLADSVVVTVDGVAYPCTEALVNSRCELTGLTPEVLATIVVSAYDADGVLLGSSSVEVLPVAAPTAPSVTVTRVGTTLNVSWAYGAGTAPASVTGWDVLVETDSGTALTGTCEGTLSASTFSCNVTGIDLTAGYAVTISATFGNNQLARPGYGYYNVQPVSELAMESASPTDALVSWQLHALVDPRVESLLVTVNGATVSCPDATLMNECVLLDLVPGDVYALAVYAYDADGGLLGSTSGEFVFAGEPSAPDVNVSGLGGGQAVVTWTYLDDPFAAGITGWDVVVQTSDGSTVTGCDTALAADAGSCTLSGIASGVGVEAVVRAEYGRGLVGKAGYGYYNVVAVQALTAVTSGETEATLTWSLDPFFDARLDSVKVLVDGTETVLCPDAAAASACVLSGLTQGVEYVADVQFFDESGELLAEESLLFTVESAPAAPELTVVDNGTSATVSWNYGGAAQPSQIVGWEITALSDSAPEVTSGTCVAGTLDADASSCTLTGLDPAAAYQIEVLPLYGAMLPGHAAYYYLRVEPMTNFQLVVDDAGSSFLTWNAYPLFEERAMSVSVTIDDTTTVTCNDAFLADRCDLTGELSPLPRHFLQVAARDASGAVIYTVELELEPTAMPSNPSLTLTPNFGAGTLLVEWSYDGAMPVGVNGYVLDVIREDGLAVTGTCADAAFAGNSSGSCVIENVAPDTRLAVELRVNYGLDLLTAPSYGYLNVFPVSDFTSLATGETSALLQWQVDPLVVSRVDGVQVLLDGELQNCPDALVGDSCEVTGLTPGQMYTATIVLLDGANVVASPSFGFRQLERPAAPRVNLAVNGSVGTLTWSYPDFSQYLGVTGWDVQFETDSPLDLSGTCLDGAFSANAGSCTITIDDTAAYAFEVRAVYGDSLLGKVGLITYNLDAQPALKVSPDADGNADVTWDVHPLLATRLSDVKLFVDGVEQTCADAVAFSQCAVTGLANGQTYTLALKLYDEDGALWSTSSKSYKYEGQPTAPAVSFAATADPSALRIEWGYADGAYSTLIDGWSVVVSDEFGNQLEGSCAEVAFGAGTTSCLVTGVTPGVALSAEVHGHYGNNLFSETGYAYYDTTLISNLQGQTSGDGEVLLTWDAHVFTEVRADSAEVWVDGTQFDCSIALTSSLCYLSGLTPNQVYPVTVRLLDGSTVFAEASTTVVAYSKPAAPTLSLSDEAGVITVAWSYAGGTPQSVTGWVVLATAADGSYANGTCADIDFALEQTSCTLVGLDPTQGYEVMVAPTYGVGLLGDAAYAYLQTEILSQVAVVPTADTQATVSWLVDPLVDSRVDQVVVTVDGDARVCPDALTASSCILDWMVSGLNYQVAVTLLDANGAVIASQSVSYTHNLPRLAPVDFTATIDEAQNVTLTWDFPNASASLMSGWDLRITSDYDPTLADITVLCALPDGTIPAATRSCVVTGLAADATYFFELRTDLGEGLFGASAYAGARTFSVENLTLLPQTQTSAVIEWNPGFGWDGVTAAYSVYNSLGEEVCYVDDVFNFNPACELSGFEPGSLHELTFRAYDSFGTIIATQTETVQQPALPLPTNITTSVTDSVLTVGWSYDPSSTTANVIGWKVEVEDRYGPLTQGTCFEAPLGTARSCTVLLEDATLGNLIRVTAIYAVDVESDPVTAYRGPVSLVTDLAIYPEANTVNSALLHFEPLVGADSYVVEATDTSGSLQFGVEQVDETTWRVLDVTPGDEIVGSVRVVVAGVSAFDPATSALYTAPDVPYGVTNLAASAAGLAGSVLVTWTPSVTRGMSVSRYTVTATASGRDTVVVRSNVNSALVGGLATGVVYTFTVTADSFVGSSLPESVSLRTIAPPAAPTVSSLALQSTSSVQVNWTPGAVDASMAPVTAFSVQALPSTGVPAVTVGANATSAVLNGLAAGVTYRVLVRAQSEAGSSLASNVLTIVAPARPASVIATVNARSATVNWTASPGAVTGYSVLLTGPEGSSAIEVDSATLSRTFTNLTAGGSYSVRIVARYGSIDTPATTAVNFSILNVPSAPTVGATQLMSATSIRGSFTAPAAAANRAAVTGYVVEATPSAGITVPATLDSTVRTATISGLAQGVGYQLRFKATSAVGDSDWSDWSTLLHTPDAVGNLSAQMISPTAVRVSWTKPVGNVTSYSITATPNVGTVLRQSAPADATTADVTRLALGVTYTFSVQANYGAYFAGTPATPVSVYIDDVPAAPAIGTVALNGTSSVQLTWTPASETSGRAPVTGYKIVPTPATGVIVPAVGADATSATVSGLSEGIAYTFKVQAQSIAGLSTASEGVVITVPSKPVSFAARAVGNAINTSWYASKGAVTGYAVTAVDTNGNAITIETAADVLAASFTGLQAGMTYAVSAKAKYADDVLSNASTAVSVRIADVPLAPTTSGVTLLTGSSGRFNWVAPVAAATRASVTGYEFELSPADGVSYSVSQPSTVRSVTLTGLASGVGYSYRVRATSATGYSDWSAWTDPYYTPSPATGVYVTEHSYNSAMVHWTAPRGNVTIYTIIATPASGSAIRASAAASATELELSGLSAGKTYTFTVVAWWGAISAAPSDGYVYTVDDVPAPPVLDTLTVSGQNAITACWTAPAESDSRSAVTAYSFVVSPATGVIIPTVTADQRCAEISGLTAGASYTISVHADSLSGQSKQSNTLVGIAPSAPTAVVARATGLSTTVTWRAPRGAVTGYLVTVSNAAAGFTATADTDAATLTATLNGLAAATTYAVKVEAKYGAVLSPAGLGSFTTLAVPNAPAAPTMLITAVDGARASWLTPLADTARALATGYELDITPSLGVTIPTGITAAMRSATFSGLAPGQAYQVRVRANSAVGDSAWSDWSEVYNAPGYVSDLKATVGLLPTATVTWKKPAGLVTGYTITATPAIGAVLKVVLVDGSLESAEVPRLAYSTDYTITVAANFSRYTAGTNSSVVVTGPPTPVLPAAFTLPVIKIDANSFDITYQPLVPTAPVVIAGYYITVNGATIAGCGTATELLATPSCSIANPALDVKYTVMAKAVLNNYRSVPFTMSSSATVAQATQTSGQSNATIGTTYLAGVKLTLLTGVTKSTRQYTNVKVKRVSASVRRIVG